MPRFQIAHVREQGVDLIIVLVSSSFENESASKQNRIIAELQLRARRAGLGGTVVPVWIRGDAIMSMAPKAWHPFFQTITTDWVAININRELYW